MKLKIDRKFVPKQALEISRDTAFGFAPVHKIGEFLANSHIYRRRFEIFQNLLVNLMRPLWGPNATRGFPSFIVSSIRNKGLVKRCAIAILRVLNTKKVAIVAH